jgi:hypothetical protein
MQNDIWALQFVGQMAYTAEIRESNMNFLCISDGTPNKIGKTDTKSGQEIMKVKVDTCEARRITC